MKDFLEWLDHPSTPEWVRSLSVLIAALVSVVAFVTSMFLIVEGYWLIPLLLWIILPSYIVARAYLERDR